MSATARTAAAALALALAGCQAQPIGTYESARFAAEGAQAQRDVYFRPGAPSLLPGEAERVNALLRSLLLRPQDDVVMTFGATGSDALDARRIAEARRAIAVAPARLRIVRPLGFARAPERPDVLLVQAIRYDQVRVDCPPVARADENRPPYAATPPLGCANAVNLAEMAAEKRDLTAPRAFDKSDPTADVAAVGRYRAGAVEFTPLDDMTN